MDKRVYKTKENIKKTVINLILEKNFQDITVTEISNRANIGRKTFYLHYGSIIDVIKELEDEIKEALEASINRYIDDKNNYDIKNIFKDLTKIIKDDILLYKRISINDSYSFFKNAFERILSEIIYNIAINVYNVNSKNSHIYTTYYAAGIIKLYTLWLKGDLDIDEDELIRIAYRSTFEGAQAILNKA